MRALLVAVVFGVVACSSPPPAQDSGTTTGGCDSGFSACGHIGDMGNALGVGRYCQTISDCPGSAPFCSSVANSCDTPQMNTFFCVLPCTPCQTDCGANATCVCRSAGVCGCTPNSCSSLFPDGGVQSCPGSDGGTNDAGVSDAGASDAGTSDAGSADSGCDAGPSICGQPGDQGNALGVGKYCQSLSDCPGTAPICSNVGNSCSTNTSFCTALCIPCQTDCGANASCVCQAPGRCGCTPNSCSTVFPDGGVPACDGGASDGGDGG